MKLSGLWRMIMARVVEDLSLGIVPVSLAPSMLPDTHLDLLSLLNSINLWNLYLFTVIIKGDDLPNTGAAD